jgi:TonB family protein
VNLLAPLAIALWLGTTIATNAQIDTPQADNGGQPPTSVWRLCPYPPEATRVYARGAVTIRVHITADGTVGGVDVAESSGYAALDQAAVKCAERWRYKPATKDGNPVAVLTMYKIAYRLGQTKSDTTQLNLPFPSFPPR